MGVFPFSPFPPWRQRCEGRRRWDCPSAKGQAGRDLAGEPPAWETLPRGDSARGGPASAGPPRSQGAPRPAPSPLRVPPPLGPGPLPAGSGRRGRGVGGGFSSRVFLTHWGARRWRHLRSSSGGAASPSASQWEVGQTKGRSDRRTDSGAARRPESPQVPPWAGAQSCGWVWVRGAPRGLRPARGAGRAGAADRRRPERFGPSLPLALAEGGGSTLLCVQTPLPSRPGLSGCWSALPPLPPRRGWGQRLGRREERPADSRVRRHPLPFPVSLLRLHFPDAWLVAGPRSSPFVSLRPEAGEGAHCPEGALFAGGEGGPLRPPARATVPGARASPGQEGAGSLEAPPTALAPGRGSQAALFRARPPASQAQPPNPFPSPCVCVRAQNPRVASGTPAGLSPVAALGWGLGAGGGGLAFGIWIKLMYRRGSQFCQKERRASRMLYFPFRCSLFSLVLPVFFLSSLPFLGAEGFRQCPVSGQGAGRLL